MDGLSAWIDGDWVARFTMRSISSQMARTASASLTSGVLGALATAEEVFGNLNARKWVEDRSEPLKRVDRSQSIISWFSGAGSGFSAKRLCREVVLTRRELLVLGR